MPQESNTSAIMQSSDFGKVPPVASKRFAQRKHLKGTEHLFGASEALSSPIAVKVKQNISCIPPEPTTSVVVGDRGRLHFDYKPSGEVCIKPMKRYVTKNSERPY